MRRETRPTARCAMSGPEGPVDDGGDLVIIMIIILMILIILLLMINDNDT